MSPRRRPHRRGAPRPWLPPGHLTSQQVAQALGISQDDVRKQRDALGAIKQRNGRLAYPTDLVRVELAARGVTPPPWFPRSLEQQRRRERRQTLALRAGAVLTAVGIGYAVLFPGEPAAVRASDVDTSTSSSYQQGAPRYGGGLPADGSGGGSSTRRAPRVLAATPTAVCRDGTLSYSTSRRGTCSHHGGVEQWGPPASKQAAALSPPAATASGEAGASPPSAPDVAQFNGECSPVGPDVLERLSLLQPDGVDVQIASGWSLQGERGTVVGGYLSGIAHGQLIDGAFGSWYIRAADDTVHRYTDEALTLSAWPQLGDGSPTPLSRRVKACAAAKAG